MTSVLLWIYMFGWKSLVTFPLWIVLFFVLIELLKNRRGVFGVVGIFGLIPAAIFMLMIYTGNAMGIHLYYAYPIVYIAYMIWAYKTIVKIDTQD